MGDRALPLTNSEVQELKEKCTEALAMSYSPYSQFRVGCAILTPTGEIFQGANVENASYGAGVCAERATICHTVNMGHRSFKAIAITSDMEERFITPCGICRQFIREFEENVPVFMFKGEEVMMMSLEELLPKSFGPEHLR